MPQNTQKTIHHTNLELKRSLNIPFTVDQYSTLNEKFGILTTETGNVLGAGVYPNIEYLAIGRGGHANITGTGGAALTDILRHGPTDACMFTALPFVMREEGNDLSVGERANYRMRTVETFNTVDYATYWLKKIDTNSVTPETRVITILNGDVVQDDPYVPTNASLNPTPIVVDNNDLNLADGRYITVRSSLGVTLDENDINEIIDACNIIYGDDRFAMISEVGVVSGHEYDLGSGVFELTHAQILNFIGTEIPLQHRPDSATLNYLLANTMPYPAP